ncbi:hypothetical protein [Dietzia sp. PP-33]|jgi:hypothetical protein|uniref:hypothetical protein n=1 Tax=Dietzia sp. PP-33 TaxID=2957500 RepID=UPI0029A27E2E|nr:hypothetical protein [Dietzia sp. PP-33]MDX2356292.1 hypothetical protein [Dietzia sp. PP-33]
MHPTLTRLLAGSAAALLTTAALAVPAQAQTEIDLPDPCDVNYFEEQDMWEISWGSPFYSNTTVFDDSSYGGLVDINGNGVPGYIADYSGDWSWLYVTRAQLNEPGGVRVDYTFEDGTTWRAEVVPDINGCPAAKWTPNPVDEPDEGGSATGSLGSLFGSAQSTDEGDGETNGVVDAGSVG